MRKIKHNFSKARILKIGETKPFLYSEFLIIALHFGWIQKFNTIPTMGVFLDKQGHLCLVSKEVVKQ